MYKYSCNLTVLVTFLFVVSCKKSGTDIPSPLQDPVYELSFIPETLPGNKEIGNPGRGFYKWAVSAFPDTLPVYDIYRRFSWRALETAKGVYDFSLIDNELAKLSKGQRFSFRVMPFNSCCTEYKNGADVPGYIVDEGLGWFYPFRNIKGSDSVFIPDWNDARYLQYAENLINALAARYDNDPRIGWIEPGLYGTWGEWHIYPVQYLREDGTYAVPPGRPVSDPVMYAPLYAPIIPDPNNPALQKYREGNMATMQRVLNAHLNAFKNTRLIQSTSNLPILFSALRNGSSGNSVGMRRDSWGDLNFNNIRANQTYKPNEEEMGLFNEQWKVAPFYSENWGGLYRGGDTMMTQLVNFKISAVAYAQLGNSLTESQRANYMECARKTGYRYQVTNVESKIDGSSLTLSTKWKNINIAPTYDRWNIWAYVVNPTTGKVLSEKQKVQVNLNTLFNDATAPQFSETVLQLANGWENEKLLHVRLIVEDTKGYLNSLNLDLKKRNLDGSYTLFSIVYNNGVVQLQQ